MTISIGEAISNIKNNFRLVHADSRVTNKYIYSLIEKHSSWIIKRESDKLVLVKSDGIWQTLNCIDTIEVPTTDPCCKYTSKCSILRTKDRLPETYEDSWGIILRSVNSIDFSQDIHPIKMSEWTRKLESANFKYDKSFYYFYRDGYLYFPNCKWKLISVTGYFKEDISKYNLCEEDGEVNTCLSILDNKWRIPSHLQAMVIDAVLKELLSTYAQINNPGENKINKQP